MNEAPSQTTLVKEFDYIQDEKKYKIEISKNSNKSIITIKDINKLEFLYKLGISLENIQNKNQIFKIFKFID